jgi:hypothetical protein
LVEKVAFGCLAIVLQKTTVRSLLHGSAHYNKGAIDMSSKETGITTAAHYESAPEQKAMGAYTGDHVTNKEPRSPIERSLVLKAGCLFTTLSALVYFVAYLVRPPTCAYEDHTDIARIETASETPKLRACRKASDSPMSNILFA